MKKLIINADDFGMSREINKGIMMGIDAGTVTSVSVMANMPFFDEAITFLKKHPEISVGLHFNITEGDPISTRNKVSTLVREDGRFFYWTSMLVNLLFKSITYKEIDEELSAQYIKLYQSGLPISHIDSHHHIHLFPSLYKKVVIFAAKQNVKALRCRAFNPKRMMFWLKNPPTIKQFIIIGMCVFDTLFITKKNQVYEVDNLYDIAWDKNLDMKNFLKYIHNLPDGTTEIICHPAVMSKTGNKKFLEPRYKGLKLLLHRDFKHTLANAGIQLISRSDDI